MTRKSFLITLSGLLAVIIALVAADCLKKDEPDWDVSYPMVNTNVSWDQTFRAGGWNEVARQ